MWGQILDMKPAFQAIIPVFPAMRLGILDLSQEARIF